MYLLPIRSGVYGNPRRSYINHYTNTYINLTLTHILTYLLIRVLTYLLTLVLVTYSIRGVRQPSALIY